VTPETRPGALPLYQQIAELLIRDIAAGRLADGERLLPERDLAVQLGIAVGTLRQALAMLAEQKLIERIHGSGNYVRSRADAESVYSLFRLELLAGGGLPTATVVSVDRLTKPAELPLFGKSQEGHRIRRMRFVGGIPAAMEEIWLDGELAETIKRDDLSESLYLFYRQKLGIWIARATDSIGLGLCPDWRPDTFPPAIGAHVPMVTRVSLSREGNAVEASWTWFDPATTRYVSRLK
jgi:GntR family transcriptional regulator